MLTQAAQTSCCIPINWLPRLNRLEEDFSCTAQYLWLFLLVYDPPAADEPE